MRGKSLESMANEKLPVTVQELVRYGRVVYKGVRAEIVDYAQTLCQAALCVIQAVNLARSTLRGSIYLTLDVLGFAKQCVLFAHGMLLGFVQWLLPIKRLYWRRRLLPATAGESAKRSGSETTSDPTPIVSNTPVVASDKQKSRSPTPKKESASPIATTIANPENGILPTLEGLSSESFNAQTNGGYTWPEIALFCFMMVLDFFSALLIFHLVVH